MIKLTIHEAKDRYVVNTPGTYVQRRPRVYSTLERALEPLRMQSARRCR